MSLDYDGLLETVGGFGKYQILVFIWQFLNTYVVASQMVFMTFAGAMPYGDFNSSNNDTMSFHSIAIEWNLMGPKAPIVSGITSGQMFGVLVGTLLGGWISDRFGRKFNYNIFCWAQLGFSLLNSFAWRWEIFAFARVAVGVAQGCLIPSVYVLFVEVLVSRWRLLAFLGGWPLSFVLVGFMAKLTTHWQGLMLAITAVQVAPILMSFLIHESPKWLMERERHTDASEVVRKISQRNGIALGLLGFKFA